MNIMWDKDGIKMSGETEEEEEVLRTFFEYLYTLKEFKLSYTGGNGRDLLNSIGHSP